MSFEPLITLKLEDTGTRFKHYAELLELWRLGYLILCEMNPVFLSDADKEQRKKLSAAIGLLEKQMEVMSGYNKKVWDMRDEINKIPKRPKMLEIPIDNEAKKE